MTRPSTAPLSTAFLATGAATTLGAAALLMTTPAARRSPSALPRRHRRARPR
ncbi:MAG: hypothetical protein ACR2JD_07695 [Nocardioides sp.]